MKRREFPTLRRRAVGGLLLYTLAGEPFRTERWESEALGTASDPCHG